MADSCIIFSDPTSTTKIQIATRDGSQSTHSDWAGTMKFTQLKVTQSQDRNATASFVIHHANTSDNIDYWMKPGIGVFVVHLGMLRFSGVITKADGMYLTYGLQQQYTVSCESDANYLMNYSPLNPGTVYKNTAANTVIKKIISPYTMWYDVTDPNSTISGSVNINYTVSNKTMMTQIKEICATTGYKFFCRTKSTYGTATIPGGGTAVTITGTTPDDFRTYTTNLAWGTHNKYILVLVARDGYFRHDGAAAVTATDNGTHIVTDTSTNAINQGQFNTGSTVLLIQQPIIYFQKDFAPVDTLTLSLNPASNFYNTVAFGFNPGTDKNDIITKVTVNGTDNTGLPVSSCMAAAYQMNASNVFIGRDSADNHLILDYCTSADSVDAGSSQALAVWGDLGYTWAAGDTVLVSGYVPIEDGTWAWHITEFTVNAGFVMPTAGLYPTKNGRPIVYLTRSAGMWNYTYPKGSFVSLTAAGTGISRAYVNALPTSPGINNFYFIGREYIKYVSTGTDRNGLWLGYDNGQAPWTSPSRSYTVTPITIPHKKLCPVLDGAYFDVDDSYSTSPMHTYGLNNKTINSNVTTDIGTLEIFAYNAVRYLCKFANEKGSVSCYISSLASAYVPAVPGDTFTVTMYDGSTKPASGSYAIMSVDLDFDQGTAVVQFGQYNIDLMKTLSLMGLDINIL